MNVASDFTCHFCVNFVKISKAQPFAKGLIFVIALLADNFSHFRKEMTFHEC
jgi:hypothetical protein